VNLSILIENLFSPGRRWSTREAKGRDPPAVRRSGRLVARARRPVRPRQGQHPRSPRDRAQALPEAARAEGAHQPSSRRQSRRRLHRHRDAAKAIHRSRVSPRGRSQSRPELLRQGGPPPTVLEPRCQNRQDGSGRGQRRQQKISRGPPERRQPSRQPDAAAGLGRQHPHELPHEQGRRRALRESPPAVRRHRHQDEEPVRRGHRLGRLHQGVAGADEKAHVPVRGGDQEQAAAEDGRQHVGDRPSGQQGAAGGQSGERQLRRSEFHRRREQGVGQAAGDGAADGAGRQVGGGRSDGRDRRLAMEGVEQGGELKRGRRDETSR
jgi:hypothetical protein